MNKDQVTYEVLSAMIINALEFNAAVVQYSTELLAHSGGQALKRSTAKRISNDFKKLGKSYTDRYQNIIKELESIPKENSVDVYEVVPAYELFETKEVLENMEQWGGSFVQALAKAFRAADSQNFLKLKQAFPDIWKNYSNFKS